jgi:hypothetical protein
MNRNAAATALLVPALFLAGCSSSTSKTASTSSSTTPATSASAAASSASSASNDQATPASALTHYLSQIVNGDYSAICSQMQSVASSMPTPTSVPSSECISGVTSFHQNFVTDGLTPASTFTVDGVKSTGKTVTINGKDIHVAGTTLTALMVAHSTGIQSGQLDISFELSQIDGSWYVTNMNMNVG